MKIEAQLKQEILLRYKSVRAFTTADDIPYTTLDSVLKRGIANAEVSTMIKVFDALDLDIKSVQSETLRRLVPTKNFSVDFKTYEIDHIKKPLPRPIW